MENILEFVKPELLALVPVLYFLGIAMKRAEAFADKYIPTALGVAGVALAAIWVAGTSTLGTPQEILLAIFTALVQGIICAGLSVYCNQLIKQATKGEDEEILITEGIDAEDLDQAQLFAVAIQLGLQPKDGATREELLAMIEKLADELNNAMYT